MSFANLAKLLFIVLLASCKGIGRTNLSDEIADNGQGKNPTQHLVFQQRGLEFLKRDQDTVKLDSERLTLEGLSIILTKVSASATTAWDQVNEETVFDLLHEDSSKSSPFRLVQQYRSSKNPDQIFSLEIVDAIGRELQTLPFEDLESALATLAVVYVISGSENPEEWKYMQPYPSAPSNLSQQEVHALQAQSNICKIYSSDSNSVVEGRVKASEKIGVVDSTDTLIKLCHQWTQQNNKCGVIEFAGHAYKLSIGMNNYAKNNEVIIGVNCSGSQCNAHPNDASLTELKSCLSKLLASNSSPILFSTCGGAWEYVDKEKGTGYTAFYRGKKPAQQVLSNSLGRTVISPVSYCCSSDGGRLTSCPAGWFKTTPDSL